jgi:uncharacterized protein (TIGR00369 family)
VPEQNLSEEEQERRRRVIADLLPSTPFLGWLGVTFDRYEHDEVVLRVPFREDLTNDGTAYHGGVIAAALDTAGAAAAWSNHDFGKGVRASTVSMSIQYIGTAKKSDLICSARTIKRGRELIFSEISATDENGMVVAHAVQTYRIV